MPQVSNLGRVRRDTMLRSPYDREILHLALPALGALVAEPLYGESSASGSDWTR
jgi:hypothetical protein